jgi:Holliday junction resolvasome RuvABC endonuclease subunit
MPAPTKEQLKPMIEAIFKNKGFEGERITDLSDALAEAIAQSLTMFMIQVKVAPGIPASPTATIGPGNLM